jgi:hypothetical protein
MNRPPSDQIDTIEQRARAFGYRNNLLPYCQFFATSRTIATLRGIVHTEDDLRANLRDALETGGNIADWAKRVGLFLPDRTKPTRDSVVSSLSNFNPDGDWFALRKPLIEAKALAINHEIVKATGILDAATVQYQRLAHRTLALPLSSLLADILMRWQISKSSPGWQHEKILELLMRKSNQQQKCYFILLSNADGSIGPRKRKWAEDTGFVNLFQGEDVTQDKPGIDYKGDRKVGLLQYGEDAVVLQVHHVSRRDYDDQDLYTLAIHLGEGRLVKRDA